MTLDPLQATHTKDVHDLLLGAVSPRPIALASTIDRDGNVNLSPFSFFNVVSTRPAILIFSPNRRQRGNTTKHTLDNIIETGEVVINTVSYAIAEQVSLASSEYDKGVNEFVKAGLTEEKSERVKPPRVKESPVSFECRVIDVRVLGTEGGAGNLVVCEVLLIHAQDQIFNEQGVIDPRKSDNVARMGGNYYCRVNGDNIFEIPKPTFPAGIGFDGLPAEIRCSRILTGNNLGRLATIDRLPGEDEINAFAAKFDYSRIVKENGTDSLTALHRYAQQLLTAGEIKNAWLLLLSANKVQNGVK